MTKSIHLWRQFIKHIRRTLAIHVWVVIGVCWVLAAPIVCIVHCHWHAPTAASQQLYVCDQLSSRGDAHATGLAALPLTVLLALELVILRSGRYDLRLGHAIRNLWSLVTAWQLVHTPPPKYSLI